MKRILFKLIKYKKKKRLFISDTTGKKHGYMNIKETIQVRKKVSKL